MTSRESSTPEGFRGPQGTIDYQRQGEFNLDAGTPASKPLNPKTKRAAVLRCFLERGAAGLNCFESVRLAHDYVLRTTVSELVRYNGIQFLKRFEQVPGFNGSKVDCVRYTLTAEGEALARELIKERDAEKAAA